MAIVYVFDPVFDVRGWFSPVLTPSGWFDEDWSETTGGSTNATANPATVALVLAQPAVSPQAGSTASPAVAPLVLAQPAVSAAASTSATANPAVVPLVLAQPAVLAQVSDSATLTVAALVLAQPAVTVQASATPTPATVPLVLAQPAVTATATTSATANPDTAALVLAQPAVSPQVSDSVAVATAALALTVPSVSATGGSTTFPDTVPLVLAQPAVSLEAGATASPATVPLVLAQPAVLAEWVAVFANIGRIVMSLFRARVVTDENETGPMGRIADLIARTIPVITASNRCWTTVTIGGFTMQQRLVVGDEPTFTYYTTGSSGALANPTVGPVCTITPPYGDPVVYTYGVDAELVRDSTGVHHVAVLMDLRGTWIIEFTCTVAGLKDRTIRSAKVFAA